jgi:protein transport protein YIF1
MVTKRVKVNRLLNNSVMAFVTYILLSTLLAGLRGAFQPELLGYTASTAFAIVIFEILGLKLGCYLLSISNESQLLDLVAYSGYKFVGIIISLALSALFSRGTGSGGWAGWLVFAYTFFANAFFLASLWGNTETEIMLMFSDSYGH